MAIPPVTPWSYPEWRYYYDWIGQPSPLAEPTDGDIKSAVVERLKTNTYTADDDIKVDVKQRVVILGGQVSSWAAKRAAGAGAPRGPPQAGQARHPH
jgi:hypothetical protein